MLPSIQSRNLPSVTAESFNPDQLTVLMAQLLVSISGASRIPEALLMGIAELNIDRQEAANILNSLISRRDQTASVVTADSIDAALKNKTSLTSLFGSDPGSLGPNLEQAQKLMDEAEKLDMTIDVNLRYPVLVISSDQEKEKEERLVWMSQAERFSLDVYPVKDDENYAPYLTRLKEGGGQTTLYVSLDDQANLRIDRGALGDAIIQATELSFRGETAINIEQLRLSTALEDIGSAIRWVLEEVTVTFKNKLQTMEAKRERMTEDAEVDRIWLIQMNRLISALDELIEVKNGMGINNG